MLKGDHMPIGRFNNKGRPTLFPCIHITRTVVTRWVELLECLPGAGLAMISGDTLLGSLC